MNIFIKTKKYLKNTLNLVKGCPSFGEYYKALELKAEIDKIDKEIDQMVYALYGLTEEEIKIVEGVNS